MAWPYHLVDLTESQKHERRELLDRYGVYAQLSIFIPIVIYQLYRLLTWVFSERQRVKPEYAAVPSSPSFKRARQNSKTSAVVTRLRHFRFWLGGEVADGWGTRALWALSIEWTVWLLVLSVLKTGDDYLHLTKRLGIVAASQFPLHYLLSSKSRYNPIAWLFGASHEQLNPYHRALGRIIYLLLLGHGILYLNFFVLANVLYLRLTTWYVTLGVIGLAMMTVLMSTALKMVRRWSYRAFYITHIFVAITLLPVLFFHVSHIRIYIVETALVLAADFLLRKLDTITCYTAISVIPNTDPKLIRLIIPIPKSKMTRFEQAAGQHVYLSVPAESSQLAVHRVLSNPFTIADVDNTTNMITLVLRSLNGPITRQLFYLTKLNKARPPIKIEGPYGSSRQFPDLATAFDRILLVAGGVGGTFIVPLYRDLMETCREAGLSSKKVQLVWVVRSKKETSWAVDSTGSNLLARENVRIYTTAVGMDPAGAEPADVELKDTRHKQSTEFLRRPDLEQIVNATFRAGDGERVAILVCGPRAMGLRVRILVAAWVERGRHVWFHDEGYGW